MALLTDIRSQQINPNAGPDLVGIMLVVLYLLGIYTYVVLRIGVGIPWIAPVASITGILLLLRNRAYIQQRHTIPILLFVSVALLSLAFAPGALEFLGIRTKSVINLAHSLIIGFGIYLELITWRREDVGKVFLIASLAIVLGTALENYSGFKSISDAFREFAFPADIRYDRDFRDEALVFMIRPKLFTSEPSHVAKFLLLTTTMWLTVTHTAQRHVVYMVIIAVGFFLIRSPILVLGIPIAILHTTLVSSHERVRGGLTMGVRVLKLATIVALGSVMVFIAATTLLANRLELVFGGGDDSATVRSLGPAMIARDTIAAHPTFGAGVGGREAISDIIIDAYSPIINYDDFFLNQITIGNVFWLHWIFFGVIGGTLAGGIFYLMIRNLASGNVLYALLTIFIFAQTMGAYVTPRFWVVVFLISAAARQAHERTRDTSLRALPALGRDLRLHTADRVRGP